jgi:hypothetical protein
MIDAVAPSAPGFSARPLVRNRASAAGAFLKPRDIDPDPIRSRHDLVP